MIFEILSHWRWVLMAVLAAGAFVAGIRIESDHRDAAELVAQQVYQAAYHREAERLNTVAQQHEQHQERVRTVTRTITKEVDHVVEKPVYRNVCLDPDGVRLANAALAGRAPDPGKPDAAVPAAHPAP